jgi:hypothetical protein
MRTESQPSKASIISAINTQIIASKSLNTIATGHGLLFSVSQSRKKPRRRKIKAAIRRQLDNLEQNNDATDALIAPSARLSTPKAHWWQKLLVISKLHRQQTILLYAKTRSFPDRIVSLFQRYARPIARGKARAAVDLAPRSVFPCVMALPSYTGSAEIRTMNLKI